MKKRKKIKLSDLQMERHAERGLECRACGCRQFEVVYTRPLRDGRIKRRRACRHCGKKITTFARVA